MRIEGIPIVNGDGTRKISLCICSLSSSISEMATKAESKRTANFAYVEITILLDIVKQYRHIIECKQSDKVLWSKKNQTWLTIAELFNARSNFMYRDATVLKKKYENLKKVTKKRYADEKCGIRGVGVPSLITPIDEEIKQLTGVQIDGYETIYNSDVLKVFQVSGSCVTTLDAGSNNGNQSYMCLNDTRGPESSNSVADSSVSGPNDTTIGPESSNSVADSSVPGKGLSTDKWQHVAEAKLELVHLQCSFAQKEHEMKKKLMNEEQELKRRSYEQKMQHEEEEHNLRMQKLKYELQVLKKDAT